MIGLLYYAADDLVTSGTFRDCVLSTSSGDPIDFDPTVTLITLNPALTTIALNGTPTQHFLLTNKQNKQTNKTKGQIVGRLLTSTVTISGFSVPTYGCIQITG